MCAKVFVKRMVQAGYRKGPSDLLVISDHEYEEWLNEEAVRYLREQKQRRSEPVAVIK